MFNWYWYKIIKSILESNQCKLLVCKELLWTLDTALKMSIVKTTLFLPLSAAQMLPPAVISIIFPRPLVLVIYMGEQTCWTSSDSVICLYSLLPHPKTSPLSKIKEDCRYYKHNFRWTRRLENAEGPRNSSG